MSSAPWYYTQSGTQHGPVSKEELKRLGQSGQITRESLVWQEGWPEWRAASSVDGLFPTPPPIPNIPPPSPGNASIAHQLHNGFCERCGCSETYIQSTGKKTCSGGSEKAAPNPVRRSAAPKVVKEPSAFQGLGCVILLGVFCMVFVNETRGITMILVLGVMMLFAILVGGDGKK